MLDANAMAVLVSALIAVESGGDTNAVGDNKTAIGILQIHQCVLDDIHWRTRIFYAPDDRKNPEKSKEICRVYLTGYGYEYEKKTGKKATPEVLARIWNGGPNGWQKKNTLKYWQKVKRELYNNGRDD